DSGKVGALGKQDGRYFLAEDTNEAKAHRIKQLADLTNLIKKSCRILNCRELAGLEPKRRDALVKAFGQHGAESVLLASEPGRVLWTDDYVVAHLAQKEFGVHRVWTQLFLQTQAESGEISTEIFSEASARLVGCGYYFTSLNLSVLVAAARIANGDPSQWPLKQALMTFSDEALSAQDSLSLITQFIVEIFKETMLTDQGAILVRSLEHLASRKDGISVIRVLQKALPRAMGLNVLRAQSVETIIAQWLSNRRWRP